MEVIYSLYLKNISDEREKLCKEFSITWAAEESDWLLSNFLTRRNAGFNVDFSNKDILIRKLCEIPTILIEKEESRQFISIDNLKDGGHFWTIECEAFNSANRLLKEIKSSRSVVSILRDLYGDTFANLDGIDTLLNKKRFYNLIDEVLLAEFQISDIKIVPNQRRLDLCWNRVSNNRNWARFPKRRDMHNDSEACFVQLTSMDFNSRIEYDGIKSTYGIILLNGSPITQYIVELINSLNISNEDDFAILSDICYLVGCSVSCSVFSSLF
ncbi:hypothetical protein [Bacteroides acidifaciens]|uniref:hypothetical protein n=2 Tax=Bacteroides acidifaciens TaxID=85831 RepID=UPI003014097B